MNKQRGRKLLAFHNTAFHYMLNKQEAIVLRTGNTSLCILKVVNEVQNAAREV